ncbi:hypothetical protein EDEG_01996 [Edhazardia aedis USNM 41457]|uniref:Uncharacterized protein n=1 Tax=Edhazardia aedis (strain USNM 41457) TaxID=1003232 RepID=J9D871_EDHAE|nr:hypothetical protein EDEG_01996 [Edhazardia aedis USNM 41457]|eukprot:EJW03704.1 hypothetical protein EDEG_01996 [Edhazardia aedis USNM 41457]
MLNSFLYLVYKFSSELDVICLLLSFDIKHLNTFSDHIEFFAKCIKLNVDQLEGNILKYIFLFKKLYEFGEIKHLYIFKDQNAKKTDTTSCKNIVIFIYIKENLIRACMMKRIFSLIVDTPVKQSIFLIYIK